MSETDFIIYRNLVKVIDVGGQKSYRGVWANFFDDAAAFIFVISVVCFDQRMEEDPSTSKMIDASNLFLQTINHPLLKKLSVILLLNKADLLPQKLQITSLRKYFPDLSRK